MQGKDFIFAIQSKDNRFWSVNASNDVVLIAQPYFLKFAPSGWQDVIIKNVRNAKYWSIDRSVSAQLNFVRDGARILKHIFYKLGIEESAYISISSQRLDFTKDTSYGFWYKQIYRSELDLSTFQHDGTKVTCAALEDGLAKYLKANENTEYEFPLNDSRTINVKLDGIRLHDKANYQIMSGDDDSPIMVDKTNYGQIWNVGVTYLDSEGDNFGISAISSFYEALNGNLADILSSDNCILQNFSNHEVIVSVAGEIKFTCAKMVSSPPYSLWMRFAKSTQTISDQDDYRFVNAVGMSVNQKYSFSFSYDISLKPNEKLFLHGSFYGGPGTDVGIQFDSENKFSVSFITRRDATFTRAFRPQTLFELLINEVTEGNYQVAQSQLLKDLEDVVFTSGNGIRALDDATVKIKLSDFYKWWDCFEDAALFEGPDGKVNMTSKDNTIKTDQPIALNISAYHSFKTSVEADYLFNELDIGYPEIKSDVGALNGNEEFNTKFVFSMGTTKSPKVLDKISPFSASCYEIEKIRTTKLDKDSTDYKSDNDVFLIHVEHTPQAASGDIPEYYLLDRILNTGATGLMEPESVFNIGLSPKRMLRNIGGFIRSSLYLSDTKTLKFISADKNNKLIAGGITENADVNIGSLAARFFYPVKLTFDVSANIETEDLLSLKPQSLIEIEFNGDIYAGIINSVSVAPATRQTQAFELLTYADTDLSHLIDYNG